MKGIPQYSFRRDAFCEYKEKLYLYERWGLDEGRKIYDDPCQSFLFLADLAKSHRQLLWRCKIVVATHDVKSSSPPMAFINCRRHP